MSKDRWQHVSTFKDVDNLGVRNILVWNSCNGPYYVSYASDDWFRITCNSFEGWELWREVPAPSQEELGIAERAATRAERRALA